MSACHLTGRCSGCLPSPGHNVTRGIFAWDLQPKVHWNTYPPTNHGRPLKLCNGRIHSNSRGSPHFLFFFNSSVLIHSFILAIKRYSPKEYGLTRRDIPTVKRSRLHLPHKVNLRHRLLIAAHLVATRYADSNHLKASGLFIFGRVFQIYSSSVVATLYPV